MGSFGMAMTRWVLACGCEPCIEHCNQCDARRARRTRWEARRALRLARDEYERLSVQEGH